MTYVYYFNVDFVFLMCYAYQGIKLVLLYEQRWYQMETYRANLRVTAYNILSTHGFVQSRRQSDNHKRQLQLVRHYHEIIETTYEPLKYYSIIVLFSLCGLVAYFFVVFDHSMKRECHNV